MAQLTPIRLLLIEDDYADLQFLRGALEEAASLRVWPGPPGVEIIEFPSREEACDVAFDGAFDAILLNLSLPDSSALHETFQMLQSVAPSTPLLVLADEADTLLARQLLREGAQDVLLKATIDPAPLAIALGNAIERQRFVNGMRFAAEKSIRTAELPAAPAAESGEADDVLLSLLRVTGISAAPEIETAMLAD